MTITLQSKPQVGDIVMDEGGDIGLISLIEPPTGQVPELYFVHWSSGGLTGYTTAHHLKEIHRWSKNVRPNT